MKSKKWIALLLIAALAVAAMSVNAFAADGAESQSEGAGGKSAGAAGRSGEKHREKIAEPDGAIGRDKAKETALADAGPDAGAAEKIRVRVAVTEDGTVCYKVSFTAGEQRYSYRIDALTGEILKKTAGSAAEHEAAKPEHGAEGGKSDGSGSRRGRNGSGRAGEAGSAGRTAESASETEGAL